MLMSVGPLEEPDAAAVASRAAVACQQLSQQLARLVGELGTRTLFDRSLRVASSKVVCVATPEIRAAVDPYAALRDCLERESPAAAVDAATHVFVTYVALLERLIGTELVASLIHEAWPSQFPSVRKEIP